MGRALFILSAVLAGVPVLMLTLFFGGISLQFVAAGYALTIGTVILSAAIGVNAACHTPDSRTALVRAYSQSAILVGGLFIPPLVLVTPFAMLTYTQMDFLSHAASLQIAAGFGYPLGQIVIAWMLTAQATRILRKHDPTAGPVDRTLYPEPPRGRPAPILFGPPRVEPRPLPPLDDADPVLWKERHTGRTRKLPVLDTPVRWLGGLFTLIAVMLFATGGWQLVKRALRAMDPVEAERLSRRGPEPPDSGVAHGNGWHIRGRAVSDPARGWSHWVYRRRAAPRDARFASYHGTWPAANPLVEGAGTYRERSGLRSRSDHRCRLRVWRRWWCAARPGGDGRSDSRVRGCGRAGGVALGAVRDAGAGIPALPARGDSRHTVPDSCAKQDSSGMRLAGPLRCWPGSPRAVQPRRCCCGGGPVRNWRSRSIRLDRSFTLLISTQSKLYGVFGSFSWRISSTGSCLSQPA